MSVSASDLMNFDIMPTKQMISEKDAILYALSTGYASEPTDRDHLQYTSGSELSVAASIANTLCHPGFWTREAGVNWQGVVHAEQRLHVYRPIPLNKQIYSRARCVSVVDRGVGRNMFVTFERTLFCEGETAAFAKILHTDACRLDGGCGNAGTPPQPLLVCPERAPDDQYNLYFPQDAALLYCLNGDANPLHFDPDVAHRSGFERPILHGLCTLGYTAYALSRWWGLRYGQGFSSLKCLEARFVAPVYPGEHAVVDLWQSPGGVHFRVRSVERDVIVLSNGNGIFA